jgi:hypothetical protein
MSEQRRYRQELRQGFHQFAMGMYQSYLETHSETQAKGLVVEAIKEQLGLFMADDPTFGESAGVVMRQRIEEYKKLLIEAQSYDSQMYVSEKIDTLTAALEILESKA